MRAPLPFSLGCAVAWAIVVAGAHAQFELDRDAMTRQMNLGRSLRALEAPAVRDDLQLSEEQVKQMSEAALAIQAASLVGTSDDALTKAEKLEHESFGKILTPAQTSRLKQIERQKQTLGAQLQDDEVAAGLKMTPEQREQIKRVAQEYDRLRQELTETQRQLTPETVNGVRPPTEQIMERSRGFAAGHKAQQEEGDAKLRALLTPEQLAKLGGINGAKVDLVAGARNPMAFISPFSMVRLAVKSGPDVGFFLEPEYRAELTITDEQVAAIDLLPAERFVADEAALSRTSLPSSFSLLSTSRRSPLNDLPAEQAIGAEELARIFSPAQLRRARELTMQKAVQKYGPIGVFEYAEPVAALSLRPDQVVTLATTAYEQRRELPRLTLARLQANLPNAPNGPNAAQDQREEWLKRADERLAEILSPEQLASLEQLKGIAFAGDLNQASPQTVGTAAARGLADLLKYDFVLRHLQLTRGQAARLNPAAGQVQNRPTDDDVLGVLTPEQQAKLIALYGKPPAKDQATGAAARYAPVRP